MLDFAAVDPANLWLAIATLTLAGLVRGFAGFGAGMIYMPVAASLMPPPIAAASFLVLDSVVALPLVVRAARICDWKTVTPTVVGAVLFVHAGAWLLANTDVLLLRWTISALVIALLALLVSGWRYHGTPTRPVSFGVGAVAGVLGGVSQVSGPPVVAFWLSGTQSPAIVRANLIMFFALASLGSYVAYWLAGFFTLDVLRLIALGFPAYALAIFLGSRGFGKANPALYRVIAYTLIAVAALTSLPILDGLLR
ncbi:sulfite exporter TauE/SafE family protein [Polymorphum gilvum]|uniref:Probable membrane transporter protein n=1 Tax=Polymorphum gilvum (strain LMG 25793 / CGMCC 1.9160 / SL003B-26A1) TaxID=991905 RepID=F2IX53_POLGS|nr:sulfite exporter TauE/SafE family protein [Polymorphum gilvum]ADZ69344.1 Conserved domain protein, putative [Polymorphum gilvum SL003B-26A1]